MLSFKTNLLQPLFQFSPGHWLLLALSLITLLGSMPWSVEQFGYDSQAISRGEVWRSLTAWLTQLNVRHWLLNQWGLIVLWILWPAHLPFKALWAYLWVWVLCSAALLLSDYGNYVGLSGLLYGWLVIGAVRSPHYPVWVQGIFLGILSGKVLLENLQPAGGSSGWVGALIAADVAHESHLWGLLSGWVLIGLGWLALRVRLKRVFRD